MHSNALAPAKKTMHAKKSKKHSFSPERTFEKRATTTHYGSIASPMARMEGNKLTGTKKCRSWQNHKRHNH